MMRSHLLCFSCVSRLLLPLGLLLPPAFVAGCRHTGAMEAKLAEAASSEAAHLQVIQATMRDWPQVVRVQGSLLADEHAVVGAKVAGRVKTVNVDLGSIVHQGDPLIVMDTEDLDLKIKQAEAQLEQVRAALGLNPGDDEQKLDRQKVPAVVQEAALRNEAKANLARALSLTEQGAVSQETLQEREAQFEVAEARLRSALNDVEQQLALIGVRRAQLALARQNREDANTLAPFEGVVEQRHVAPGTYLEVGKPIVSLVRTNPLRFHVGVPEREAVAVRLEQEVSIKIEGRSDRLQSRVTRISPALDMSNRSLTVEVDVPNPDRGLQVGLFAEGEILVGPRARTLAVPVAAVNEFAGVEKVWLVRDAKAAPQVVMTGRRTDQWIEILAGLEAGDWVAATFDKGQPGPVVAEEQPSVAVVQ